MEDFFATSWRLLDSGAPVNQEDFELVRTFRDQLEQLHARTENNLRNIESIFNLVEMGKLLGLLPSTSPENIKRTSEAVQRVLTQTIEYSCEFPSDKGKVSAPQYYRNLVTLLSPLNQRN